MPRDMHRLEGEGSQPYPAAFGSPRLAFRAGARQAFGVPAVVLGASFLGFGALVHQAGLTLWHGLFSTVTAWALPGQIAFLELYTVGASLFLIGMAVALVNARLLPMTITLMPLLRAEGMPRWAYYFAAYWIAVTAWVAAMRICPHLPPPERLPYFTAMSLTLWSITLGTTAAGFLLAGSVPAYVTLGLVFLNPIYFMLVFAAEVRARPRVLALLLGAVIGPPLYLVTADWSLLITGLVAGSLAFLVAKTGGHA